MAIRPGVHFPDATAHDQLVELWAGMPMALLIVGRGSTHSLGERRTKGCAVQPAAGKGSATPRGCHGGFLEPLMDEMARLCGHKDARP